MITRVVFPVLYVVMLLLLSVAAVAVWHRVWWLGLIFGGCALSGFSGALDAVALGRRKAVSPRRPEGRAHGDGVE